MGYLTGCFVYCIAFVVIAGIILFYINPNRKKKDKESYDDGSGDGDGDGGDDVSSDENDE